MGQEGAGAGDANQLAMLASLAYSTNPSHVPCVHALPACLLTVRS